MKGLLTYYRLFIKNTTGNAALTATGSGDVLTGMITSLLAQGYEPVNAALFTVLSPRINC
jgi:NAD(P)H-hydrate repair Nnr-like enzyme with NAD(P)H-hydrate dehydratase domain